MRLIWLALLLSLRVVTADTIAIQPLGKVKAERLEVAKRAVIEATGVEAEVLEAKPLPKEAWYEPRSRWRAELLLDHLEKTAPAKYRMVIGITSDDISTTKGEVKDYGIFGQGELAERPCVISTFRLNARGADEAKLRDRLRKIVIHEAGHCMGLEHCPTKGCVMHDAESSILTVDGETGSFCEACAKEVATWKVKSP